MKTRRLSLLVFAASASIFGTYACVGDDPTTGSVNDADSGSDAAAADSSIDSSTGDAATTDSGITDSGVDSGPIPVTRVFRSSMKYFGSLGGIDQADIDCQSLATAASLGVGWKAWMSNSTTNAKDRIVLGSAPITLVDGTTQIVAHGTDLLGDGGLEHVIDHDESGNTAAATAVWTGTAVHGVLSPAPNNTCHDWLVEDGGGGAGAAATSAMDWTYSAQQACSTSFPIYCFGP